jgi:hypothetical protein
VGFAVSKLWVPAFAGMTGFAVVGEDG